MPDLIPDADWDWARRRHGRATDNRMDAVDTAKLLASHRAQAERIEALTLAMDDAIGQVNDAASRGWTVQILTAALRGETLP